MTDKREKPILFSGEMVNAILNGRKTQTRRVVKIRHEYEQHDFDLERMQDGYPDGIRPVFGSDEEPNLFSVKNPYGVYGDRLWVRETFRSRDDGGVLYAADCPDPTIMKWQPSIHMHRRESRINLTITGIWCEPLQRITPGGIIAEGLPNLVATLGATEHFDQFIKLWDGINAKRGYSWESNPWVWVVGFRKVDDSPMVINQRGMDT